VVAVGFDEALLILLKVLKYSVGPLLLYVQVLDDSLLLSLEFCLPICALPPIVYRQLLHFQLVLIVDVICIVLGLLTPEIHGVIFEGIAHKSTI